MKNYTVELPLTPEQVSALREVAQSRRTSVQAVIASAVGMVIAPVITKRRNEQRAKGDWHAHQMKDLVDVPDLGLKHCEELILRRLAGLPAVPTS